MPTARSFMFAMFTVIVMTPTVAQEAAVNDRDEKPTPAPTEYSASEYRISSVLADETIVEANGTPLSKLLLELSAMHDINITVDKQAFTKLGISPDKPVTLTAKKVPLGVAIGRLTDQLNLTYIVRGDSLLLTSARVATRELRTKVIMVVDALNGQEDMIIKNVTRSVRPELWKSRGGNCEITANGTEIRVVGNERLFQDVGSFLDKLSDGTVAKAQSSRN